jgi:hypothetical protein
MPLINKSSEQKFLQALEICQSLAAFKYKPTNITFDAIQLFCEIAKEPSDLLLLIERYSAEVKTAYKAVYEYGTNADNWRVDCELGFGVKDHCSILSFFLNLPTREFEYFTGNLKTPEIICELIADWKDIDLTPLIEDKAKVLTN